MRPLRLLSFGPGSPCWTAQVAPLYVASQRPCASACAAHEFVSLVRVREQGARDSIQEVRLRTREWTFVSSLREFSELSSTSYGGFGVPAGLLSCHRRLSSRVAGKKGKKAEKDVLLKDREEEMEAGHEKVEVKNKKKKLKELEANGDVLGTADGSARAPNLVDGKVESADLQNGMKGNKKGKSKVNDGEIDNGQTGLGMAQNGGVSEEVQEPKLQSETKGKKKVKSKNKCEVAENEQSETSTFEIDAQSEQKEKKKTKDLPITEDQSVAGVYALKQADEMEDVEDIDVSAFDGLAEELEEHLDDDDFWEDDFEPEAEIGDGGDGGGIVLRHATWAKAALHLAEEAVAEFSGDLEIFAFKASKESELIRVRLDKLLDKYGSPTLDEIEKFSSSYSSRLDKAGEAGTIPDNLALEVSSPGAERVVRIPQDLQRFKDLPMYVRYMEKTDDSTSETFEKDGVLELDSVDMQAGSTKWKLANVRLNRELAGKGRGLNKKQRDWRAELAFESIQLVRLYIDL